MNPTIEIDTQLSKLWELTDELIADIKSKTHRASCRIGTTIEMKNDKKRVDHASHLIRKLDELSMLFFRESGELENSKQKLSKRISK